MFNLVSKYLFTPDGCSEGMIFSACFLYEGEWWVDSYANPPSRGTNQGGDKMVYLQTKNPLDGSEKKFSGIMLNKVFITTDGRVMHLKSLLKASTVI